MNFIVFAGTDIGTTKDTNQDSLSVKKLKTRLGNMTFAILCDGMGGLSSGEVASASVLYAFDKWLMNELPALCRTGQITDAVIRSQWERIITEQNKRIAGYGRERDIRLGTTVVVMLLTKNRYYILNVGDSRAYEIGSTLTQITKDQTVVAREVEAGLLTWEQAETDSRRSILLQCVGASERVCPDMFFGEVKQDSVYMLCSDGFRHEITQKEIYEKFQPEVLTDDFIMEKNINELIVLNKQRMERDNISVILIRTF
ncbi:MAG: serine/threonine-protein phosphatase [Lachnospiraceae bacterium]|nr:serine/threonine-protein phosphatase [Lachnospiraceae bacterium]